MYLIDTNIILEYLLDRNNADSCGQLLELIETGEITAVVTVYSLHSVAVILEQLESIAKYKRFLNTIYN